MCCLWNLSKNPLTLSQSSKRGKCSVLGTTVVKRSGYSLLFGIGYSGQTNNLLFEILLKWVHSLGVCRIPQLHFFRVVLMWILFFRSCSTVNSYFMARKELFQRLSPCLGYCYYHKCIVCQFATENTSKLTTFVSVLATGCNFIRLLLFNSRYVPTYIYRLFIKSMNNGISNAYNYRGHKEGYYDTNAGKSKMYIPTKYKMLQISSLHNCIM